MPRKPRIDISGFHHVINRGVNRENIFLCDEDKNNFIQILEAARELYNLTVHSFCILDNHYHLLIETHRNNLSLAVRYINSLYSTYFNKKMQRIGPLWQGRFKSWYVHSDEYLWLLIRYIEMNPIKVGLSSVVGEYPFSSSYFVFRSLKSDLLVSSLLHEKDIHDWLLPLNKENVVKLAEFNNASFEKRDSCFVQYKQIKLQDYFQHSDMGDRNESIFKAFMDGYMQGDIARYLNLSAVAISRIVGSERAKRELFAKVQGKGLFWSYAPDITYDVKKAELLIETILKYADLDDIKTVFALFGTRLVRQIWETRLKNDARFKKLNYFLARVLFKMDVEANDFAEVKNTRGSKLRLLAG
ncbi:MAG: transposase [Desulfuromusa sp.]|jgi:putative transposase|nr:transposase [Desulfuromusa sp.]